MKKEPLENAHDHLDPLTGEPGSHPLGTGIGATIGGATLGAIGVAGGPVGVAVGVTVGAILGGLTGKGVAEGYDPTAEDAYWRSEHPNQPYAGIRGDYDRYAGAYRAGHAGYREGKTFEEREADLRLEYEGGPQKAAEEHDEEKDVTSLEDHPRFDRLEWSQARLAARAAYQKVEADRARLASQRGVGNQA